MPKRSGVLPSVTYPSHTSLITGVPPAVHGILDNRFMDPEDRSAIRGFMQVFTRGGGVARTPDAMIARRAYAFSACFVDRAMRLGAVGCSSYLANPPSY